MPASRASSAISSPRAHRAVSSLARAWTVLRMLLLRASATCALPGAPLRARIWRPAHARARIAARSLPAQQTVAKECGTSLQMLDAHYAFAVDDLRRFGLRPVDIEWRAARAAADGPERHGVHLRAVA